MRPNRRNYYRILHVQPDAPTPVIKASFRAMMSKMRLHPDLGGDTAEAQLINEAYAALSDPSRRRRYDLTRQPVRRSARTDAPQASAIAAGAGTTASREYDNPAICAFCSAPAPSMIKPKSRCPRCESPLTLPPSQAGRKGELLGRRAIPRVSRSDTITLIPGWQSAIHTAQLRDMSISGIRVLTDIKVERHRVIRIIGALFDVVVRVLSRRANGRQFELHCVVLRASFASSSGTFVSVRT